ncbi:MAG: membrane protein insertase YidC [Nitriliruptoraceae bacterium]
MIETIGDPVRAFFEAVLTFLHDIMVPIFGVQNSWGWAIIALTLVVRVLLLPLAIKQTRSMRAMQAIQPQIKELQKKYKVDRDLMRKDPETYKARKQKLQQEQMALFQEKGVNPAASCLPLLAQAPIFIALFWTIRLMDELDDQRFYFFTSFIPDDVDPGGIAALVSETGWPGWLLIVAMSGSLFVSQKQMMARNQATGQDGGPMAQQQKILLYVMPIFLAVVSFQFPLGLLLYWTTTNVWQIAQQAIILREVQHEADIGELSEHPGGDGKPSRWWHRGGRKQADEPDAQGNGAGGGRLSPGASSGQKPIEPAGGAADQTNGSGPSRPDDDAPSEGSGETTEPTDHVPPEDDQPQRPRPRRDHLPRRGGAND